jgi:hypothetical protein
MGQASYVVTARDASIHDNKLCKFPDDTTFCLVIPANNVHSRPTEINNTETWARINNPTLNRAKPKEILFIEKKRDCQVVPQPPLPGIARVVSLKIFGV